MADVFLSYKREDAAKVRKLAAALREAGLDAWWDEDIPGGAQWEATIEKALAEAKAVVVCWSPASVVSENVRSEARVAREDSRLVQVFLKPCTPPLFFGERQGIDLSKWRGVADDPRLRKLAENIRRVAAGERIEGGDGPRVSPRWFGYRVHAALAALILLAGSMAGWWLLAPAKAEGPMTLAVLPFRALNPADANLVDAIWDDTRGAIGRNPNLRVLGREAVTSLAKQDLQPADYRRKVGADYLLDGSVEHFRDEVRMKLSLTRTKDGTEVWSDEVGGKLDDVFAFQQRIANEVEGRVRGRVAPGGGTKTENITTNGEVYAEFAEARAMLHRRGVDAVGGAIPLLRKVVAADPNYAPAWAQLGFARWMYFSDHKPVHDRQAEAIGYLHRALILAPNLAHAHAVLGLTLGTQAGGEAELRRAIALDPGDSEAWFWLGNVFTAQNRMADALMAYKRSVEIEPLWSQTVGNELGALVALNDKAGLESEMRRLEGAGDEVLIASMRAKVAGLTGHPGDWLRIWLQLLGRHPEKKGYFEPRAVPVLLQLGFIDEAGRSAGADASWVAIYKGVLSPGSQLRALDYQRPEQFWLDGDSPAVTGRLLLKQARVQEYRRYYRAAFKGPDDYVQSFAFRPTMIKLTPTVATILRAAGEHAEADAIEQRAQQALLEALRNGPATPDLLIQLSQFRALDGHNDEAVALLRRAVDRNWLPDHQYYATDIADEPSFAGLVTRADFQTIRRRILDRIDEERRKVPLALLAQMYPTKIAA